MGQDAPGNHYAMVCDHCHNMLTIAWSPLLPMSGPWGLYDDYTHLPAFLASHAYHERTLRLISEDDQRYSQYAYWTERVPAERAGGDEDEI